MDGTLLLRLERCVVCHSLFAMCRRCYHGHTYCGDDCRTAARAAQLRTSRAKHQASPGGREDHRDRNRELRKRNRELRKCAASVTSVMDQGSEILAPSSSVCLPQGPMSGELEVEGRNHDDDDPTDGVLKTSPRSTKILVRLADDEVLKAVLLTTATPHPRALPTLLEAMALWYQTPVHAVLCATDEASWCRLGLLDDLCLSADTVHYTVELRPRERERRQHRRAR